MALEPPEDRAPETDAASDSPAMPSALPRRLLDGEGAQGDLLRRYLRQRLDSDADVPVAWDRLLPRLVRQSEGARARFAALAAGMSALLAAAAVLLLWQHRTEPPARPQPPAVAAAAPAPAAQAPPPPVAPLAAVPSGVIALDSQRRALPEGDSDLGWARARLAPGSIAQGRAHGRAVELELQSGQLALDVPRAVRAGSPLRQVALLMGAYRFRVLGAVFAAEHNNGHTTLAVRAGQVAVEPRAARPGTRTVASVSAGQTWAAPQGGSLPGGALARQPDRASLAAEIAGYEQGRARRDLEGDVRGALAAFRAQRRHHPDGFLRAEVDLSIVELLPRLGQFEAALGESATILRAHPTGPRAAELHLLRGNVYRDGLGDPLHALAEYRAGAQGASLAADEAAFHTAAVLDQLGRGAEARAAYRAYLARAVRPAAPARAAQARARLLQLEAP